MNNKIELTRLEASEVIKQLVDQLKFDSQKIEIDLDNLNIKIKRTLHKVPRDK